MVKGTQQFHWLVPVSKSKMQAYKLSLQRDQPQLYLSMILRMISKSVRNHTSYPAHSARFANITADAIHAAGVLALSNHGEAEVEILLVMVCIAWPYMVHIIGKKARAEFFKVPKDKVNCVHMLALVVYNKVINAR